MRGNNKLTIKEIERIFLSSLLISTASLAIRGFPAHRVNKASTAHFFGSAFRFFTSKLHHSI
jgi:hypothetical protein